MAHAVAPQQQAEAPLYAPPAFQFYASDFLASVSVMTLDEVGAHAKLMAWSWVHGPVPNDPKRIAAILGVHIGAARRVFATVSQRWRLNDQGQWFNRRLERTRAEAKAHSDAQANKGRAGAHARWKGRSAKPADSPSNAPAIGQPMADAWPEHRPEVWPEGWPADGSPVSDLQSPDPPRIERSEGERTHASATPVVWREAIARRDPPIIDGAEQRRHGLHAWCAIAYGRSALCVPYGLHSQLKSRLRGPEDERDARLKAFYAETITALGDREVGDRLFDFWDNAFAAWIGTVTSKPAQFEGKGNASRDAVARVLSRKAASGELA